MSEEKKLQFRLPKEEIEQLVEEQLREKARTSNIRGFRPGKAPLEFIRKKYYASTFDSVTRDKLIDLVDSYRKNEKLAGVVPTDVVYQVVENDVICDVTVIPLVGIDIQKFETKLLEEELELSQWSALDDEKINDVLQAVQEAFSYHSLNKIKDKVDSECDLLMAIKKPIEINLLVRNLSFDQYANKIFSELNGKAVGDKISLTHTYADREFEFELEITQIRDVMKGDPQQNLDSQKIKETLNKYIEDLNASVKFETIKSKIMLIALSDEDFKNSFKEINKHLQITDPGAIEKIIFSYIFEAQNLTFTDEEFKQELVQFFIRSGVNPSSIPPSEFNLIRENILASLKTSKVIDHYSGKIRFKIIPESASIDLYLSLLKIHTLKMIFDRICSQIINLELTSSNQKSD